MVRVSHQELVERWAQTYSDDGFQVRAKSVEGVNPPTEVNGAQPDITASVDNQCIFVQIIDSPHDFANPEVRRIARSLSEARGRTHALHLIVAAECMLELTPTLAEWGVEPDLVHVT